MPKKVTTKDFINRANKIHNNKYNYTKVDYNNSKTKIKIICKVHGIFEQRPDIHLSNKGCPKCANNKKATTIKDFINKANKVHDNKYDYSLVDYKNNKIKIIIICPTHGEFYQNPNDHLQGRGCPKCANNKKATTQE